MHAAAGPLNHWFYLLSQGSAASPASPTCNGSTVTGVGIQTAGKIFYNGLLLKTSNWSHGAARKATLQAAVEPVRHHQLHQLQRGQGGLERGLRAGPVR